MSYYRLMAVFFIFLSSQPLSALEEALLPPEQAYQLSAKALSADRVEINWNIHPGYYLYRKKLSFQSQIKSIELMSPDIPPGQIKQDDFFGNVEIYRNQLTVILPLIQKHPQQELKLKVGYQGCADIGVCYPPQKIVLNINLPQVAQSDPVKRWFQNLKQFKLNPFEDELLPAEQAFQFFAQVKDAHTLHVNWIISDGYYLYRDKIQLGLEKNPWVHLGQYQLPMGEPYHDEAFGQVTIYHQQLSFDIPIKRLDKDSHTILLSAKYQGCADRGVCYPPLKSSIDLQLPDSQAADTKILPTSSLSEQDQIVNALHHDSFWLTLVSFLGFGLLLAFTPCIFPMIPILSGIIVGQGQTMNTGKAFMLSFSYVLASALTYTVFGILAALFGSNLQTIFQEPWVIAAFSGIFVLLSLSMFGFYNLEMPKFIQASLHNVSDKHRDGSWLGAFVMGALSTLIVGPCVAAPLAGALIYIGQSGDIVLGGAALFSMGLGMGLPLLIMGMSAGKLLPKAGHWLNVTKSIFGVIMLAVAVWMLQRILPAPIILFLWAALLIVPAIYLNAIDPLPENASNWRKFWKGFGVLMLIYGVLLLIGVGSGGNNPLSPLNRFANGQPLSTSSQGLQFQRVKSIAELEQRLQLARIDQKAVMLDFYADWCISCKEMDSYTFSDPDIQQQLADFVLLQADVTENSPEDQALLKRFELIGPPGIIFFDKHQKEQPHARVIGYQDVETFTQTLSKL